MAKKKKVKLKAKLELKNLYFTLLSLLCVVAVSFAWFTSNNNANADEIKLTVSGVDGTEISLDDQHYSDSIEYPTANLSVMDVSGTGWKTDGEVELYYPKLNTATGELVTDDSGCFIIQQAHKNTDYLEFELFFKAKERVQIVLSEDSFVVPADPTDPTRIDTTFTTPEGVDGYSADYVAGAVRIAFCEVRDNGEEYPSCIWDPNPNYELSCEDGIWSFTENGTPENAPNEGHLYLGSDGRLHRLIGINEDGTFPVGWTSPTGVAGEYKLHIVVRIWIEGMDREAQSIFLGGRFNTMLKFESVSLDPYDT